MTPNRPRLRPSLGWPRVSWDRLKVGAAFVAGTLLLAGLSCAPQYRHVRERPLDALGGLACSGYLAWNNEPVRDVVLVINGSGALSNAFVHPSFEEFIASRPLGYMTYDKPGVHAPFGDPAAVRHDDVLLEQYTLEHGKACALAALRWAQTEFGPEAHLHLRGHSEGVLLSLFVYEDLLLHDKELAGAIRSIVLSGVPLEPFGVILERQLNTVPDGAALRGAIDSCDWPVLREKLGISCAYIDDAKAQPSGREMFERIAQAQGAAQFHLFQGTDDWNTPVGPVRELEAWNQVAGHLRAEFHYYEGGHSGTDAAKHEMAQVLQTVLESE